MIMTTQWPEELNLGLTTDLHDSLIQHLVEPFTNKAEASQFWADTPTQLLIIHEHDSADLLKTVTEGFRQKIAFAVTASDYSEKLEDGYLVYLSITSDDGGGLYLVIHNDSEVLEVLQNG